MSRPITNTRDTPVEALERAFPLRVLRYRLRRGSGGAGYSPGGEGDDVVGAPSPVLAELCRAPRGARLGARPGFVTAWVLDPFGQRPRRDVIHRCLSVLAGR